MRNFIKPIVGLGLVTLLSAGASAQAYYYPNAWGNYSRHRNYNNGYYNNNYVPYNNYNNGNYYYRYNTYPNNGYYYNYNTYPYNNGSYNNGYYYNNGYQYNAAGQIINGLINGALNNRW
ncbi:MAG: hypothetical protein KF760_32395 [Candidatus Eremiobacteraeota bacterium]|nr:hypothetical protein [Candidatus Eremiobacteraeota bacterium]MCW5872519.1 hypothetical protein [Candidatus Eremiobacteraeota bacterium]